MSIIVDFQSVSKNFGEKHLLSNVSFKIEKGTINTLIGQNGAGKTTIAKMILGLEKPSEGRVIIDKNIRIGYVPQKLDFDFNMPLTGKELFRILASSEINDEFFKATEFIDYFSIKNKDVSEISPGQLQKILLASTLTRKPELIILDEPMQFLDVNSQQRFYQIINEIKEKLDLTIFMISHDLFTVMKNSDQVICINGHVCCSGKPSELSNNDILKTTLTELGFYVHSHDHKH